MAMSVLFPQTGTYLFLCTRGVAVPGNPVGILADSARQAVDRFSAATGWVGKVNVQQMVGARVKQIQQEHPLTLEVR